MPLSMWKGRSNKTHNFIDKQVKKQFDIGGVDIFVRLYLHPDIEVEDADELDESVIQDSLLGENRDRVYSDEYYIIRGSYDEIDNEYELIAAGLAIADGTILVTLPMNDSVDRLGRKLMSGDVLEFPNLRDDLLLDEDAPAINRLYMVKDVTIQGYSQTWYPHLLRCVAKPILDSREVSDILDDDMDLEEEMGGDNGNGSGGSGSDNSILDDLLEMDEANYQYALKDVDKRGKEAGHLYFDHPESEPWIFAADGVPQNMWKPEHVDNGIQFPNDSEEGDWFLRIDYKPYRLFYRKDGKWLFVERDINKQWEAASVVQETFINNDNETELNNGEIVKSKQKLQDVVKPRADD